MKEDFILHQAKKYVAISHGFKDWDDIYTQCRGGHEYSAGAQEALFLNEVAIKYGELLLNFHNTNKRIFQEDVLHDALIDHVTKNLSDHNYLFSNKVLKMRQAGFSSNDIVFNLVDAGSDIFAKFQKLMAAWPIQYSKLPDL